MTPQEERNKRLYTLLNSLGYDHVNTCTCGFLEECKCVSGRDRMQSFLQSEIDLAISDYQTNFEQKHIASAVEVAVANRDKEIVEMIEKFKAEPLLMTSSSIFSCVCPFENGDIIELDKHYKHKKCGKSLPMAVPVKTPIEKLKDFFTTKDK